MEERPFKTAWLLGANKELTVFVKLAFSYMHTNLSPQIKVIEGPPGSCLPPPSTILHGQD